MAKCIIQLHKEVQEHLENSNKKIQSYNRRTPTVRSKNFQIGDLIWYTYVNLDYPRELLANFIRRKLDNFKSQQNKEIMAIKFIYLHITRFLQHLMSPTFINTMRISTLTCLGMEFDAIRSLLNRLNGQLRSWLVASSRLVLV